MTKNPEITASAVDLINEFDDAESDGDGGGRAVEEAALFSTAWTLYADILLHRAVTVSRARRGKPLDGLAGLRLDDDGLRVLLADLPGSGVDAEPAALASIEDLHREPLAAARAQLHDSLMSSGRLGLLAQRCWLNQQDAELLAVLLAIEIDPRRQRLVGYVNDDVTLGWLTPHSLAQLFPDSASMIAAARPSGALRRAALLVSPEPHPWGSVPIRLAPEVTWWLAGDDQPPSDLPASAEILSVAGWGDNGLVVASGSDRTRRLQAITAALPAEAFLVTPAASSAKEWDAVVRHASMSGLAVIVELDDALPADARAVIERVTHLPWAISSGSDLPITTLPRRPWVSVVPTAAAASAAEVAAVFGDDTLPPVALTADQLRAVATAGDAAGGDVGGALRRIASGAIEQLSTRIVPSRSWDDLVLPDRQASQVREVEQRTRFRKRVYDDWGFAADPSTGVIAMFSGPPGTGKTLAAEVIAGSLGLDLYRVDLSQIVNKYVGETEKRLAEVFSAAELSPVVLFFDEADALLGKRSDVSSAHDRYANVEVAYLLQRIERYNGVIVLASNLAKNIDSAFTRRIHISVEFPMPGPPERRRMWQRALPAGAPVDGVDLDTVADRFELSGAEIRNAAITAAFAAAAIDSPITTEVIVDAVKREMQKAGRYLRDDYSG